MSEPVHRQVNRQMHLALFVSHAGSHLAGWRLPRAEAGVADKLALDDIHGSSFEAAVTWRPSGSPEPLALLSALSVLTERIGLAPTSRPSSNVLPIRCSNGWKKAPPTASW